ncbi:MULTISPECIES: type II and III secretion system protein family protein [unclassified Roseitalea]|uniref:type II and III secretion system protein family protein n=1 Tax=unclassified Roseitalea TaxID=2639107 RepID=UPI0027400C57|nr:MULTISPECIES: type II and III secretion system protein family protein [unclassified Roseitalea]
MTKLAAAIALGVAVLAAPMPAKADGEVVSISGLRTKLVTAEKGKPLTIRTNRPYYEIVVGDPDIATVQPLTNQSFYVLGHAAGTTGIAFFDESQRVVGSIDLEVSVDTTRLKSSIRENVPDADIRVKTTNGRIVLSGSAPDQVSADMANTIAARFAGDEEVISSVEVTSSQQVQLNVRFVEVNRNAGQELGVRFQNVGYRDPAPVIGPDGPEYATPDSNIFVQLISGGLNVDLAIDAMEKRGLARRLAEPNLVTRSGQKANFLAGGEFPIAVSDGEGGVTVEYKKFGIGLEFTPTVLKKGLISLDIAPEVSSIDQGMSVNGFPVLLVRRAQTSVDLKSGQSFMIAGLFQSENDRGLEGLPGASRLPIIGALFSSRDFQRRETDLVMIVTPHLVRPIEPGTPTRTPLDGTRAATTAENLVLGVDEVQTSATGAGEPIARPPRTTGHILTLDVDGGEG